MRESTKQYAEDVPQVWDQVVSEALAREAQLRASLQSGYGARAPADPALENWKDNAKYWEDRAAEAEDKLARGGRSGVDTPTFSERCLLHTSECSFLVRRSRPSFRQAVITRMTTSSSKAPPAMKMKPSDVEIRSRPLSRSYSECFGLPCL